MRIPRASLAALHLAAGLCVAMGFALASWASADADGALFGAERWQSPPATWICHVEAEDEFVYRLARESIRCQPSETLRPEAPILVR